MNLPKETGRKKTLQSLKKKKKKYLALDIYFEETRHINLWLLIIKYINNHLVYPSIICGHACSDLQLI